MIGNHRLTSSGITLLLTATINPRSTIFVLRSDPEIRMIDYRIALSRWLTEPAIDRIVFCENSGADLDQLRFVAAQNNVHNQNITFVSYFAPEADGKRGKGYGEMGMLKHLLSNHIFSYSDCILKVTGRYSIDNFGSILSDIWNHCDADIITPVMLNCDFIPSECFYSRATFLDQYLIRKQEMINDAEGCNFENVLARAITEAVSDGAKHAVFAVQPYLIGISGGENLPRSIRSTPTGIEISLTADYVAFFQRTLYEYYQLVKNDSEGVIRGDVLSLLAKFPTDISEIPLYSLSNLAFTYHELRILHDSIEACLCEPAGFFERTGFSVLAAIEVVRAIEEGLDPKFAHLDAR
jgi:hypothetical protein